MAADGRNSYRGRVADLQHRAISDRIAERLRRGGSLHADGLRTDTGHRDSWRRPSTTLYGRFLSAVKGIAAVLGGLGSRPLASPAVPGATPVGMGGAVD
jgi:hypothetical protein